jgi:hypothetical protein
VDDALANKAKTCPYPGPLSGWGFSFPATGIILAPGTVGTAGSTRHCTGALARASEPVAQGFPLNTKQIQMWAAPLCYRLSRR